MPSPLSTLPSAHNSTSNPYPPNIQPLDHNLSSTQRETASENTDQYNEYVIQRKQVQSSSQNKRQQPNSKLYVVIISIFFVVMVVSAIAYSVVFKANSKIYPIVDQPNSMDKTTSPPNHFYTRHQHHTATPASPSPSPPSPPTSDKCDMLLPYNIETSSRQNLQKSYYQWYGKVGSNINGRSYDVGHFINKHVAVNGKCTVEQVTEQKSVFFDWNQVTKAYKQTQTNICPLSDRTTFSYDFQTKIASPSNYIKGIDCRSGTVRKYSRVFALYRRSVNKRNPSADEYMRSNYVTLWTFYPKV